MGKKWIRLKETGQLYLERVIVSFDIPILFVCNDFENRKYLCLNVDDEAGTTVIAETDNRTLIHMMQDKVTMEAVFRSASGNRIIVAEYDSENDEVITQVMSAKRISSDLLPAKGAFLELSDKMISEYISFLSKQLIKIEVEKFFERRTITVRQNKFYDYFSSENESVVYCKDIKFSNTKMKYSYDIDIGKKMIA